MRWIFVLAFGSAALLAACSGAAGGPGPSGTPFDGGNDQPATASAAAGDTADPGVPSGDAVTPAGQDSVAPPESSSQAPDEAAPVTRTKVYFIHTDW